MRYLWSRQMFIRKKLNVKMLGESKLFPRQVSLGEDLCYGLFPTSSLAWLTGHWSFRELQFLHYAAPFKAGQEPWGGSCSLEALGVLETPGKVGSALQLSVWTLLSPWLVLELSGLPGSLHERVSSRQRWEGTRCLQALEVSEWISCLWEHTLWSVSTLNMCDKMIKLYLNETLSDFP